MTGLGRRDMNDTTVALPELSRMKPKTKQQWATKENEEPLPRFFADVPRAASYTHIARAREQKSAITALVAHNSSLAGSTPPIHEDGFDTTSATSSGWTTPDELHSTNNSQPQHVRDLAAGVRGSAKLASSSSNDASQDSRSSFESRVTEWSLESSGNASTAATTPNTQTPRASLTSTFSRKIRRRSWVGASSSSGSSRSSSPARESAVSAYNRETASITTPPPAHTTSRKKPLVRRKSSQNLSKVGVLPDNTVQSSNGDVLPPRRSSLMHRKSGAHGLGILRGSPSMEHVTGTRSKMKVPAVPALPKSFSTDRLPLKASELTHDVPVPRLVATDRVMTGGITLPKKKDPLWSIFRDLDGEYTKFASKTLAFKTNVVRSSLLPFLRGHAKHSSNFALRPEDLDRRANILNKWWTGLIELLHGRNNQSIAGTDRPAILDGALGIMERPEWRVPSSPFSPVARRNFTMNRTQSDMSTTSSTSEFLTESVQQNVRNIFIRNLTAQTVFAIDKMSLRNAPASLVNFCGKACAYAFMFVPGMADVLVRLWDLPADPIRRVLHETGIGKFEDVSDITERVAHDFPPTLQQLGMTSLTKCMKRLRIPPPLPLGTVDVQWWGPWLERWTGRESDLFYVFVKHFHILTTDFLPFGASKRDIMCAPGFALVQAQILTNLDATIHRQSKKGHLDIASLSSPTVDDVFADPDAIAPTLPLPPTNAVRIMAENRLIMLIRDFLSERTADHPIARHVFAEAFNDVLQAAARGTSIYDQAGCYTLLDFLEEALVLLVRYERSIETSRRIVESSFWQTVSRMMLTSHNTMTEIRLYAFLYTVWNSVIGDGGWKTEICKDFLLDPAVFSSRFNHWCPMVRAYYMRLLCWRVGRYDGEASTCDLEILETLLGQLQTTWSHFLFLRDQADQAIGLPPPTQPCSPAPGRRLLIVRTDGPIMHNPALLTFDGMFPHSRTGTVDLCEAVSNRSSAISQHNIDARPDSSRSTSDESDSSVSSGNNNNITKSSVGGFFRGLIGSKSRTPKSSPPPPHSRQGLDSTSHSANTESPIPRERASLTATPRLPLLARPSSFKFSLEPPPANSMHPVTAAAAPPKTLRLLPPRLPLAAHHFLLESGSAVAAAVPRTLPAAPHGEAVAHARYAGRALAEWGAVLAECRVFTERRRAEGAAVIETPVLGVEALRRG